MSAEIEYMFKYSWCFPGLRSPQLKHKIPQQWVSKLLNPLQNNLTLLGSLNARCWGNLPTKIILSTNQAHQRLVLLNNEPDGKV